MKRVSLLLVSLCTALAQSPGSFIDTGNMATPRFGHTATLLMDGKVLIAGGYTDTWDPLPYPRSGHAITATAELYDPATGSFTVTGSMTTPRSYHTATLLPDGRVLIAAGYGPGLSQDNLASAELYDPTTGSFTPVPNMSTPGSYDMETATLLPDGRVLITGAPSRVEVYDPAAGTFTPATTAGLSIGFDTATLLPDGRVLLAAYLSANLYDFRAGAITAAGDNQYGSTGRAALLTTGEVLIAGGNDDPGPIAAAELYDPSAGTFAATGNMTAPRANHTGTLLPGGSVLLVGGSTWVNTTFSGSQGGVLSCCLATAELYDSSAGVFQATAGMAAGRAGHTATLLNNGKVLIAGGGSGSNSPALATAELFVPDVLTPPPALLSIRHSDTDQLVTAESPAVAGEVILIGCTGLTGGGTVPPQIFIGGRMAELVSFDNSGADTNQLTVRMPSGIQPEAAVPVRLAYLGRLSNQATIGVQ